MSSPEQHCSLGTCPLSASYYGYRPNLGIDIFFSIVYVAVIAHCLFVAIVKRKWLSYTISILLGALLELIGYVLRSHGYFHPFVRIGWIIQYSLITFAPVFTSAAVYVCIGRIADYLGRGSFNIRPRLYARIFIPSDVFALLIQASGGGISFGETAPADGGVSTGQSIIIAGLALQVLSLTIFFILFLGVLWPANLFRPNTYGGKLNREDRRTRRFVIFILVAILLIIGRSAFRVAEFSQGIFSSLGHNEVLFIIFDGFPIAIATSLLVIFHPLYTLPTTPRASKFAGQELRFLPVDQRS
ncbi:RTA1 like protein-domain-containing protein [Xylaria bambusicola]|uniref:RTA1 like protein-domain-containing protein n=1 Tax=Xylaria bambusicola TaxID=326684 RepID=UPI002008CEDF|nr:RTA1 like protein-domain-containing protein [Xylaria bambusicola]KAI0508855.1 RTA1 like protein-domain-containing protein [Xylaria bambusicola]